MPEQEPQPKASTGNATERLQIKFRNSRTMKETISNPRLIPATNFVIVLNAIPTQNENTGIIVNREKPQE